MTGSHPRHRQPRHQPQTLAPSTTSTSQQHLPLSRRLLFPQLPPTSHLPSLLVSPSVPQELTSELYDFIALSLRAFVNPWWSKITRYDKEFLPEITRITTFAIRAIETRVLAADLSPLVFRDIPVLVTQHYRDYRNVEAKLGTSYASGGAASLPQLFHQLQPHMALGEDGSIDEEYFRQVIDHCLKTLLPPEDYQSEAERYIVREIALKLLLRDIIPRISQPWFIHRAILDFLGPEHSEPPSQKSPHPSPLLSANAARSSFFSIHTFLIVFLSAIQSFSSACLALIHAYKQALSTIKLVNNPTHDTPTSKPYPSPSPSPPPPPPPPTLTPPHVALRASPSVSVSSSVSTASLPPLTLRLANHSSLTTLSNEFAQPPIMMVSEILTTHERFASSVVMGSISMLSASMTPFLDRLLPHLLTTALSPQFMTQMARIAKRTLFPNGYPAPPPPDPTSEEQALMKQKLLKWRPHSALSNLMPLLLGPSPEVTFSLALDPLSSAPCNVHLIVLILDKVLMTLFPELGGGMDLM